MPSLTVSQNIGLPVRLGKGRLDHYWMDEIVERTGLADRLKHRPSQLSGGQQQRVAIARALVTRPDVLFADEPTGALDTTTGREVLELMRQIVDETAQTVVMVTHDPVAAAHADRVVFLADGELAGFLESPTPDRVADRMTHLGS
jgi:putative ABC transport system ATP-binding protein